MMIQISPCTSVRDHFSRKESRKIVESRKFSWKRDSNFISHGKGGKIKWHFSRARVILVSFSEIASQFVLKAITIRWCRNCCILQYKLFTFCIFLFLHLYLCISQWRKHKFNFPVIALMPMIWDVFGERWLASLILSKE